MEKIERNFLYMKDNIYIKLGKNVVKLRTKAGLTISQLSKNAQIDKSTLISIEKGVANPLFSTLLKLSKAFRMHPTKLCEGF